MIFDEKSLLHVLYKFTLFRSARFFAFICATFSASALALNLNPTLTNAGIWTPVTDSNYLSSSYNGGLANTFHALIPLGPSGQYGMAVTGWGYSGWPPTLKTTPPVSVAILSQDSSGNLGINTTAYISDPVTNGGGSLIVADFNGDGKPDIFLAAHNESPFIAMPSTAYLSNASGGFSKVTLSDHVMAHDAELVYINGKPAVITGTFAPGDSNPIYTFSNGAFVENMPTRVGQLGGMDATLTDSGGAAGLQIVRGDVNTGWDPKTGFSATQDINVYAFDGTDLSSSTPIQIITPYLSTLPQYKTFPAAIGGPGLTHTYRVWAEDLNHDGKQDILAGESMWSQSSQNFPSALQILINKGDGTFRDATAALNPDMSLSTSEMDYNPMFIDLDHSGINTYLFAGSTSWGDPTRQSDYILLNDGTGRLYIGLHDQFTLLAPQVFAFLGMQFNSTSTPPRFIAIPQTDGSLNFVAEVPTNKFNSTANILQVAYQYVNVPLRYNPATDFTQSVTVSDRNGSMLMRTWAGNDTFHDKNASSSPTSIDGGLGINTSVYSGKLSEYTVTRNADGTVTVIGNGLTDKLKNIQKLQFSDALINLAAGTPTINNSTLGYGSATVSFTPAVNSGGARTESGNLPTYTATCSAAGQTTQTKSGAGSPLTVQGLTGGVTYSCFVTATNSSGTSAPSSVLSVTPLPSVSTIRTAFFVNSSSSANKSSVLRVINLDSHSAALNATAYDEAGNIVGTASADFGTIANQQMLTFTSSQLEAVIGYAPSSPVAKYRIVFGANLPSFEIIDFIKDIATGNLTLGQAQIGNRAASTATTSSRNAFFVNPSTGASKTSVVRLINTTAQNGTLTATAYSETGSTVGKVNASLGIISAQQMLTFTSGQLEAAIGYIPASSSAKYRVAFNANLPNFEVINFVKDNATGNLTLAQAQIDDRDASSSSSSIRNAFFVNASSSGNKTSVVYLVNPSAQGGTLTATAYNEAGSIVGTAGAPLGSISAQQMLSFTSAQLETAIGYVASSSSAKYRVAFNANLPSFELINFIQDVASGNLILGQAQIDDGTFTTATSTREALFVNASTSGNKTSVVRLINANNQAGIVTATAYDESGKVVGTANVPLGTINAQQMLTYSSMQLEALIGYMPASATAKYRIVFNMNLPSFEVINFIKDLATGNLTLGQILVR
jgi:hypothetical protein